MLLNGMGLSISKRQVVRLMSKGLENLIGEDEAVLRAGLETSPWVTVDDAGYRHDARRAYQEFRVRTDIMGKKETHYVPTQGTCNTERDF